MKIETHGQIEEIVNKTIEEGMAVKLHDTYWIHIKCENPKEAEEIVDNFIKNTYIPNFSKNYGEKELTYEGQFTRYTSVNGVNIRFIQE